MSATTAAVIESPGAEFRLEELELDGPRPGEAIIDVDAAGICHTDLTIRDGAVPTMLPGVLGHEAVGRVAAVGSEHSTFRVGDRVALSFASCGACPRCVHGTPSMCAMFVGLNFGGVRPDGSTALRRDGAAIHSHFFGQSSFATRTVALESSLVKISDDVPDAVAATLGCGVQTGAGAVLNILRPPAGATIAVFGAGTVGLSAVMAAKLAGCGRIIAIDLHEFRLDLALELGATDVVNATGVDVTAQLFELTRTGADYVVETTGAPAVIPAAVYSSSVGGVVGLIGGPPPGTMFNVDVGAIISLSKTIRGIIEGDAAPRTFVPQLIDLWRRGQLPIERLVSSFDFDQINEAAEASTTGRVVKPVLKMHA